MKKKAKHKLLSSCVAAALVLSSTLAPVVANAATPSVPSNLTRLGGYDQYATAALIAQKGWSGTTDHVVLSAGMTYNLVDALAAGPLAASLNAPILLTDGGQALNSSAKAELLRLKPKKVYITSGTAVIKQSVLDEIQGMGITPVQLGGFDQYETSVNIAKEMASQGVPISRVMIAAGWLSPADALSVSSIAAAQGIPILTTTKSALPNSVKTYLDSIKPTVTQSYIVGGTAVVSDAVKANLPGKVSRHSGLTKYDTNVQILKSFAKDYKNDKVYVANGETLVDALAGVPLAAADQSPVVLVHQQLGNATKDFVKKNLSTVDMVALGGEAVVPTAGMNALTSNLTYATDNATEGSTDAAQPLKLTDNLIITGDDITLQNAQADYSVYVKGNNITLSNLNVKGTVFVDPGDTGSATLDGVTAASIVILSGAKESIHLKNTSAGVLTVDSSSDVHVEGTGTTTIGNTVVRSFALLNSDGASMGEITITSTPGQSPVVELKGTFTESIVVSGQVTLKAAAGAVVPNVVINTETPTQKVTLDGNFKAVEVQSTGKLDLAANTVVDSVKTIVKAEITVPAGSSIGSLDSGSTGTVVGGGGDVNGETTPITPTTPTEPTTPPSTGGGGGGGGTGSGGTTEVTKTQLASSISTAQTLLDSKTVGTAVGNVPSSAKSAFQSAINQATLVYNNTGATQSQVDGQVSALATATSVFMNAVITTTMEDQLVDKLLEVYGELTPSEKDTLDQASSTLQGLGDSSSSWNSVVTPLLTPEVLAYYDTYADAKLALIHLVKDYSALYYSQDRTTLETNLETFRENNRETFRTLFGNDFTMEEFYGFLTETQETLPEVISGDALVLFAVFSGTSAEIKDQMIAWTKEAMHEVADPLSSDYHIFTTKLSALGLNLGSLVEAQRQLGTVIDSTNAAEKAVVMAAIRSQIQCSIPGLTEGQIHELSLSVKDLDTGALNLAGALDWYSSNTNAAIIESVSGNPTVKAVGEGTTDITAYKPGSSPSAGNELIRITVTVSPS